MKSRAAVALEAGKPLELVEIDVQGPKAGEVLVKMAATSVCHTDAYTLSGADPEGNFPPCLATKVPAWFKKLARALRALSRAIMLFRFTPPSAASVNSVCRVKLTCVAAYAPPKVKA